MARSLLLLAAVGVVAAQIPAIYHPGKDCAPSKWSGWFILGSDHAAAIGNITWDYPTRSMAMGLSGVQGNGKPYEGSYYQIGHDSWWAFTNNNGQPACYKLGQTDSMQPCVEYQIKNGIEVGGQVGELYRVEGYNATGGAASYTAVAGLTNDILSYTNFTLAHGMEKHSQVTSVDYLNTTLTINPASLELPVQCKDFASEVEEVEEGYIRSFLDAINVRAVSLHFGRRH